MATNGSFSSQDTYKNAPEQYTATASHAESSTGSASGNGDLSKDQVGWYFVEQYYTTLSKSPEKLHLFYGKRSQFVSGLEAEVAPVSVGRCAIQERIRDLEFQDCKVRVSNVDSQASFENIVIQVIGETSNKSAELRKFVQTFVLAQQPTGYFVLNDIFRYINEEDEEEQVDAMATEEDPAPAIQKVEDVEMPKPHVSAEEPAPLDTEVVAEKLNHTIEADEVPTVNGIGESENEKDTEPEEVPTPEDAEKQVEEELQQSGPEKPQDPVSSPVASKAVPAQPAAPPKPMSWANRAAAAVASAPKPVVPIVTPKTSTPAQNRSAAPNAPASKPSQAAPVSTPNDQKENTQPNSGWQSVGSDHAKRQNRPQSISSTPEKEGTMGYVRNVTEKVGAEELRAALSAFGELIYFDINRSKNCAFVEYQSNAGYQAASAANPHQVAGENIFVEPRRPKTNAYGGAGYTGPRNAMNNRPRSGFDQGRPGGQAGRGNFQQNRGGRGGAAARGRGGTSQAANA